MWSSPQHGDRMAGALDPRLAWKLHDYLERRRTLPAEDVGHEGDRVLAVNLTFEGDIGPITAAGFHARSVHVGTAAGTVQIRDLEKVLAAPGVILLESSRRLGPSLDTSVPAMGAAALHTGMPPY